MRTRVKICCIASWEEAAQAIRHGADALGLVGPMPTGPGVIDDVTAAAIAARTPPPMASVLLTSETSAEAIAEHVRAVGAATVQIVQHIAPEQSARLAALAPNLIPGARRMQVIHVEGPEALALIPAYAPHVHAFLLDSGRPSLPAPELGGTGRTHDWTVSAEIIRAAPRPVFLAGGLTPGNVAEAIRAVRPFGVDVCSGLRMGGALDEERLAAFMAAVRAVDAERL